MALQTKNMSRCDEWKMCCQQRRGLVLVSYATFIALMIAAVTAAVFMTRETTVGKGE
jgi:hypothetical protein